MTKGIEDWIEDYSMFFSQPPKSKYDENKKRHKYFVSQCAIWPTPKIREFAQMNWRLYQTRDEGYY